MFEGNRQIKTLVDQGFTLEEAAESLGMDVEAVRLAMASRTKVDSIEEMIEKFKPRAIKVLMEVAEFGENESAKVKAAQILLEGKGVLPDLSASQLSRRLENMKRITEAREDPAKLVDVPAQLCENVA